MTKTRLALFAACLSAASPAFALDVARSVDTPAAPDKVWETVGDFCGIGSWHPAVTKCEETDEGGVATRKLTLGGKDILTEQLVKRDDATMSYTYRIIDGPLPVANYKSTIAVKANGQGSTITWDGAFDAKGATDEEAASVIGGIYDAGIASIVEKAGM